MANVKKSVPFNPEILEEKLSDRGMSLNELALQIAKKNNITKQAEMTSLRRYKRNREISLSALEDIGEILDLDPDIFRGSQIKYVDRPREKTIRSAETSDLTYQKYLDRKKAVDNLQSFDFINKADLEQFLSSTPLYVEIQRLNEAQYKYYLHLLSSEIQRLLIVAAKTEVEIEYTEVQGKTIRVDERFKVIRQPDKPIPHPEDFYVSKKG